MRAAVALVTRLGGVGARRPILAVADGPDLIGGDAQLHQEVFGGSGAAVTQAQVVLGRPALIAMPFEHHSKRWVVGEDLLQLSGVAG